MGPPVHSALRSRVAGLALLGVLVMTLLSALLVFGGARLTRFSDMLAGQDADETRALLAAQALLSDAEVDVLGPRFELSLADHALLRSRLGALDPPCQAGVCLPLGTESSGDAGSFWHRPKRLQAFVVQGGGAFYGRHTGGAASGGNPLLQLESGRGAWYWVEVLPYQAGAAVAGGGRAAMTPLPEHPFVYRITAVVQGRRAESRVVLQSVLVRHAIGAVS